MHNSPSASMGAEKFPEKTRVRLESMAKSLIQNGINSQFSF